MQREIASAEKAELARCKEGKNKVEEVELNLRIFKQQLFAIIKKEKISACDGFKNDIANSETSKQLYSVFKRFKNDVYERLGGWDEDVDALKEKVDELEEEVECLENELRQYEYFPAVPAYMRNTLHFEMKVKTFFENQSKFTIDQIEEMFNNKIKK